MKKILLFGFATLLAAGLAGCVKENISTEGAGQNITIVGERSDLIDEAGTKVYFEDGNSYWNTDREESIGIFIDEQSIYNVQLSGTSVDGLSVEFGGSLPTTLTGGEYLVYSYYPYGTLDNSAQTSVDARIEIPSNQYPTFTSFDSKAAVMYSGPTALQIDGENAEGHKTTFNYAVTIANVIVADIAARVDNEPVTSFKITMPGSVTGRVELNLQDGVIGEWYSPQYTSNSVFVEFDNAADFVFNGTNGIHIGMAPIFVAMGEEVIIEAETENYTISKTISVPRDADFAAGMIKNLKINEPIVVEAKEVEIQLPSAVLDQAAIAALSSKAYGDAPYEITAADGSVWNASGTMKSGSSSNINYLQIRDDEPGTITTPAVSNINRVVVNCYASGAGGTLSIFDSEGTLLATEDVTTTGSNYADVEFTLSGDYSGSLQMYTINTRTIYISSISINTVGLPTLKSDPASITGVSADGATGSINITSNAEGGWMAESLVDWIELDDNTAMGLGNGSIDYTILANESEEARSDAEAIYITDGDLEIYVSAAQLGKAPEGGGGGEEAQFFKINVLTTSQGVSGSYAEQPTFTHNNEFSGGSPATAQFDLTFGIRNGSGSPSGSITIGANSGAFTRMTLGDKYEAGINSALSAAGIAAPNKAAALVNNTSFSNVSKIIFKGGFDNTNIKLVLAYSTDGVNWTIHPDGEFTPTATGGTNLSTKEFVFSTPQTGYFATVALFRNTGGNSRIQNVSVDYFSMQ